jgi:hypothetical protein
MSGIGQIVLVTLCLAGFLVVVLLTFYGSLVDKTYDWRMKPWLRPLLMPGRLKDKAVYAKYHKVLSLCGLAMAIVVFVMVLLRILK